MNDVLNLVGDIPDDPRIKKAVEDYQAGGHAEIMDAITQSPTPAGLEKYGIKLRTPSLMHSAMLTRIKQSSDVPQIYQPFIYIYTLAAPIREIYKAMESLKDGLGEFMAKVHEWFETSGIPKEASTEVVQAVAETFELAAKLAPKAKEENDENKTEIKKNLPPGSA